MCFSDALKGMKDGKKMQRKGWNGKDMFVYLADESELGYQPFFIMKTAQGHLQPGWLASQADMLAEDWEVCTLPEPRFGKGCK